jgi:hypothetical protein
MTLSRTRRARRELIAVLLLLCSAMLVLASPGAAAKSRSHSHAIAYSARTLPRPLLAASRIAINADHVLVADAKRLKLCLQASHNHKRACSADRRALQRAGGRLANAERRLARLGRAGRRAAKSAILTQDPRQAPTLTVSGQTLQWTRVAGMNTYVYVRKVAGQPDQYSVVSGTSLTPPPVPGQTVRYSVRTTAWWSAWATEKSITYPPAGQPVPAPDRQAAPTLSVSGGTVSWSKVADVTTYVFVRKVPGQPDQYSEVSGTSVTPPAVPGATVRYGVRTAVEGSAWAPEVAIVYAPSSPTPTPPTTPPATTPPPTPPSEAPSGSANMVVGLDTGGWAWSSAVNDASGAVKHFRASYKYYNSDSQMELLAKAGVTLMPLFGSGGTLAGYDTPTFFNEIVTWFKRYGHGGTFWAGKPVDLGATTVELINEPGNPYFYPDYSNYQLYANITKSVHSALEANFAPAVRPKLLVSYDGGFNGSPYGRAIFAAGAVADGVTVHPYGGHGANSALGGRERVTQAHNETGLPVYVTEVGWPTALGQEPTGDSLQWSELQQAENITSFISWARGLGYVNDVTYFNYADYGANNWYGIVNSSGTVHKLSYGALKAAAAAG